MAPLRALGLKSRSVLIWLLCCVVLSQAGILPPLKAGAAPKALLEDLKYRIDFWILDDAARGRLTLKSLGSGRYQAELSGEAQGLLGLLSGGRRDSYQTEMIYDHGRLRPVVYREESRRRGKHYLKEYRFDYSKKRLELWQLKERQGSLVLKWHTDLKEAIYDPLSAFYNGRLGLLGPIKDGDTYQITGIPYPAPETIEVSLGQQTQEGRRVMVALVNAAFEDKKGLVFILFNGEGVPTLAWTRVLGFGKISGKLLPDGKFLKNGLADTLLDQVTESGD